MRPCELVQAWVDAFNQREVERLAAFCRETANNHQVPEAPVSGREAIRSMFKEAFAQADRVCIPEYIFEDGKWTILEWRDPVGMRGRGFFHVADGKIVFQLGYWDKLTFLKLHRLPLSPTVN